MSAFLGFHTTETLWLRAPAPLGTRTRKQPRSSMPPTAKLASDVSRYLSEQELVPEGDPLHFVISDRNAKRTLNNAICHVWQGPLRQSFFELSDSICISTPEATWRQMAISSDLVDLVQLGYDLCASFVPLSDIHARRNPLTFPDRLSRFLEKTAQGKGCSIAREALSYIAAHSASPRETAAAMFFCLPRRVGGYGLPAPSMNVKIPLHRGTTLTRNNYYVADLMWPEHKLCVEYDSDLYHSNEQRAVLDSTKRNALLALGYHVVTLTNQQIKDTRRLDEVASALARLMGKELRIRSRTWAQKRYILRKRLLFPNFRIAR